MIATAPVNPTQNSRVRPTVDVHGHLPASSFGEQGQYDCAVLVALTLIVERPWRWPKATAVAEALKCNIVAHSEHAVGATWY